ncbi:hypothetical protein F383_35401 [Gossypium arboreum]|uniref:Uncharacterized protein n=1 Tax=Gossypium arboreum TaxID=29729 RepID=A0A0B0N616_GOSAR|nr:hypothetical protein F383_35401 [Gossypium arboreum]
MKLEVILNDIIGKNT